VCYIIVLQQLQCDAVCCSVRARVDALMRIMSRLAGVLQCVAVCLRQHVAVSCSVSHYVAMGWLRLVGSLKL